MAKILITGGTGLIGSHLCPRLKLLGHEIRLVSREKKLSGEYQTYLWDPSGNFIEEEAVESVDCVIHLAGLNIGDKRWTPDQKQKIIDSRVASANLLYETIRNRNPDLKAFISSSAVGYYGNAPLTKVFDETDPPGNNFLSQVCIKWEQAADQFQNKGMRTVKIRAGVVLSKSGGVLEQMSKPVKLGIGSPLGSGKQYIPWIHMDDLCSVYVKAIEDNEMKGAYNAVSPEYITNAEFLRLVARITRKPFVLPAVPSAVLKMVLGERAAIVLEGNKVASEKLIKEGFRFSFAKLEEALENLLL